MKQIKPGIFLNMTASNKYKTNHLMIKFISKYDLHQASQFGLISQMMTEGSNQIQNAGEFERILADLYGANVDLSVQRKGIYHEFTAEFNFIRGKFIDEPINDRILTLVKDILFNQTYAATKDLQVRRFNFEKRTLLNTLKRRKENKAYVAKQALMAEIYQNDPYYHLGAFGDEEIIEQTTIDQLGEAYGRLINDSRVVIVAHGDFDQEQLKARIQSWPLNQRHLDVNYHTNYLGHPDQPGDQLITKSTQGRQGNLMRAYEFKKPKTYRDRLVMQVANAMFGGLPSSQLFTQVREAQSLAYSIGSSIDYNRELLLVHAGIDSDKGEYVYREIDRALDDLISTIDDNPYFNEVKLMFKSNYIQDLDEQEEEVLHQYASLMLPQFDQSVRTFINTIDEIDVGEVERALRSLKPVLGFMLKGVSDDGTEIL